MHQVLPLKLERFKASPSLFDLEVNIEKEIIKSKKLILPRQRVISVSYQRESFRRGAVELRMNQDLPKWVRAISFWVFDYKSGNNLYVYLRTEQGLKRYKIARINHIGWRQFIIPVDSYKRASFLRLEKVKIFNRKYKGGAFDFKPLIKVSRIEIYSHLLAYRDFLAPLDHMNIKRFIKVDENLTKKTAPLNSVFYRIKRGVFWEKNKVLTVFFEINSPAYVEIYGSLLLTRNRLFALNTPTLLKKGTYRLDVMYPKELAQDSPEWEESGTVFWGLGVYSISDKLKVDFKLKRAVIWPSKALKIFVQEKKRNY